MYSLHLHDSRAVCTSVYTHVYNFHRGVVSILERIDYIYVLEFSMGSGISLDTK